MTRIEQLAITPPATKEIKMTAIEVLKARRDRIKEGQGWSNDCSIYNRDWKRELVALNRQISDLEDTDIAAKIAAECRASKWVAVTLWWQDGKVAVTNRTGWPIWQGELARSDFDTLAVALAQKGLGVRTKISK